MYDDGTINSCNINVGIIIAEHPHTILIPMLYLCYDRRNYVVIMENTSCSEITSLIWTDL